MFNLYFLHLGFSIQNQTETIAMAFGVIDVGVLYYDLHLLLRLSHNLLANNAEINVYCIDHLGIGNKLQHKTRRITNNKGKTISYF